MKIFIEDIQNEVHYHNKVYTLLMSGKIQNGTKITIRVEEPLIGIKEYVHQHINCLLSISKIYSVKKENELDENIYSERIVGKYIGSSNIQDDWLDYYHDFISPEYYHGVSINNEVLLIDYNDIKENKLKKNDLISFNFEIFELRAWYKKGMRKVKSEVENKEIGDLSNIPIFNTNLPPPSHHSDIGYILTPQTYKTVVLDLIKNGIIYEVPPPLGGYYFVDRHENGVEFWIAINKKYYVEAGTPYYRSDNENYLILNNSFQNIEWRYEGGFVASSINKEDVNSEIDFQNIRSNLEFALDVPNYALLKDILTPKVVSFSITAFVDRIDIFNTEEELLKSQMFDKKYNLQDTIETKVIDASTGKEKKLKIKPGFAVMSFIPQGLFSEKPQARAFFSGKVKTVSILENKKTNLQFYLIRLRTYGFVLDLVADKRYIPNQIKPDNFVSCRAWIIGHYKENWNENYRISNPKKVKEVRAKILKNLSEFGAKRDQNPYQD